MPPRGLDLKPRTVGELLDASFLVYRHAFWRLLIAATIVSLPTLIVAGIYAEEAVAAVRDYFAWAWENVQRGNAPLPEDYFEQYFDAVLPMWGAALLQALLQAVSRGGAFALAAVATWHVVRREPVPGVVALLRESVPRIPAVIVANVVISQIVGNAMCCLPVGIVLLVVFLPAPAVMMLERGRLETAVRRRMADSHGFGKWTLRLLIVPITIGIDGAVRSLSLSFHAPSIGRGTLYAFFLFLFLSFFVSGLTAASQFAASMLGSESYGAIFWAQHYAEVIILPVVGIGLALWYLDLRARREGLDMVPMVAKAA